MRYVLVHPELVVGGAERLIIDLAQSLTEQGNNVEITTAHIQRDNAFDEIATNKVSVSKLPVLLPRTLFGKFRAILAYLRMCMLVLYLVIFKRNSYDCFVLDQVSLPLIILRLLGYRTVFYCHYPDFLQGNASSSMLKTIYRLCIFLMEFVSMKFADLVVCNSEFTKQTAVKYFRLDPKRCMVLYPTTKIAEGITISNTTVKEQHVNNQASNKKSRKQKRKQAPEPLTKPSDITSKYFLCLNRVERRKKHDVIIKSFIKAFGNAKAIPQLIIAGALNMQNPQDKVYLDKLNDMIKEHDMARYIQVKLDISDKERSELIRNALCVLYPPENEHFGIVPLEAMAFGVPVIAHKSGGPLETIEDGKTGYLVGSSIEEWAAKMKKLTQMEDKELWNLKMASVSRFNQEFNYNAFTERVKLIFR